MKGRFDTVIPLPQWAQRLAAQAEHDERMIVDIMMVTEWDRAKVLDVASRYPGTITQLRNWAYRDSGFKAYFDGLYKPVSNNP